MLTPPHARHTRRAWLRLAGLAAAGSLLAACQQTAPPAPTAVPAAPPAPAAPQAPPAPTAPAAASAAKPASATTPARGGVLTLAVRRETGELDIHKPTSGTTQQYARFIYNTLTTVDLKGNVTGELAESWTAPDPKTYVFNLRKGVLFHDGTEFNAESVKFNFDRVRNPDTKSTWLSELTGIDAMEVVDTHTIRFRLKDADVTFPGRMSGKAAFMLSPTAVRTMGDEAFALKSVGTGPFEVVDWIKDDRLQLKRFDRYWQKDAQGASLPYLDGMVVKAIPDATVTLTALRTNDIQLVEAILPSDLSKVTSDPALKVSEGPGALQIIWLNNAKPPFDNRALRQAISYAIDREAIHKALYFNTGEGGTFFQGLDNWGTDRNGKFYTRDLARAKALLAEGGQPDGFKFTINATNVTADLQLAQALKAQFAEVGVDASIVPLTSILNNERRVSGDFEASLSFLTPRGEPHSNMFNYIRTGSSNNRLRYSNAQVDEMLDKAVTISDQAERARLYHAIQAQVLDDAPLVFVHLDADMKGMRATVNGYTPAEDTYIRVERLWLQQ